MANIEWLKQNINFEGNECLTFPSKQQAYPKITFEGQSYYAHRLMCILVHGKPAPKNHALHSCHGGIKGCVNPRHLRWGSPKDNAADRVKDGTHLIGEQTNNVVLTEEQVIEIRNKYANGGYFQYELAKLYNVSQHAVQAIVTGFTWKHVDGPIVSSGLGGFRLNSGRKKKNGC